MDSRRSQLMNTQATLTIGKGNLRQVCLSYLQDVLQNLYNVRIKIDCRDKPFKSDQMLPDRKAVEISAAKAAVLDRLDIIFPTEDANKTKYDSIASKIIESTNVEVLAEQLELIGKVADEVVRIWKVENELFVGVIPSYGGKGYFEYTVDTVTKRLHLHWSKERLLSDFMSSVGYLSQLLRNEKRQPSTSEFLAFQLAYYKLSQGQIMDHSSARCLGTPGFRPYTQTYMSITDPGEGHLLGTTRFNEWMKGANVHMEHLERPNNLPRKTIESYRIPSIYDFARVRLHVGSAAPNTIYIGRFIKDSGSFEDDFLKLTHIMAATCTAAFLQGAAECKISMEGLTTSQAVRYMIALRGQVQKKDKQVLAAAWDFNQEITDDFGTSTPKQLKTRMEIAMRAIDITDEGGFTKLTWDGASDTYPSKCIMFQISSQEALTLTHEAHSRGLITYFSAGFKFDEIKLAVFSGIDGVGIGGAQTLRFMDHGSGMHGPYTEENIPEILRRRDEAAKTIRGRGVRVLARLDTMFYEGSISAKQNILRSQLFSSLLKEDEAEISTMLEKLQDVEGMKDEKNEPLLGTAERLIGSESPLLKNHFQSESEWQTLLRMLKSLVAARDADGIFEEYENDLWLNAQTNYRKWQFKTTGRMTKQESLDVFLEK